ncbi:hypothetical protein SAMN05421821_101324 [Mucilaginibacter lappiensis]|nr:hypothetical protein SAMN05421821_101324 [Mucilaginibacter lappiensis]
MGSICIIVVFCILLFKNEFSNDLRLYLRILFALGIAGLSAALLGNLKINTMHINGVRAAGGFAMFVLVYIINPVGFKQESFDITFMLKNKEGKSIKNIVGNIDLYLGNDKISKKIAEDETAEFKQIPISYNDNITEIEIQIPGWQFPNGTNYSKIKLNQKDAIINIEHDDSLCCITGTVTDEEGNYLQDVAIMVDGINATTNKLGFFELKIPAEKRREEQKVIVAKTGYKSFNDSVYPATKAPLSISLQKK